MPLFYQHNINADTKLGIWHITETEQFFLSRVPLPRGITHWHKRLQHLAGRFLLQQMFPDFPYHLVEIADTRKPFLVNEEYHFSISHCGDYAAVIISKSERVGIDLELVTPKPEKIKFKFLNHQELAAIEKCPPLPGVDVLQIFTLLWSCKEAVFKWDGRGGIDFKKHIQIASHRHLEKVIDCRFLKYNKTALKINYLLFDSLCLCWVIH